MTRIFPGVGSTLHTDRTAPHNLSRSGSLKDNSIEVSWAAPTAPLPLAKGYELRWRNPANSTSSEPNGTQSVTAGLTSTIHDLQPAQTYLLRGMHV